MKPLSLHLLVIVTISRFQHSSVAAIDSGSDGRDGTLNPTTDLIIDMADHPDGIYRYASVHIPAGISVSFIPNAANKPVVWLVQGNCKIDGSVDVSGKPAVGGTGGGVGRVDGPAEVVVVTPPLDLGQAVVGLGPKQTRFILEETDPLERRATSHHSKNPQVRPTEIRSCCPFLEGPVGAEHILGALEAGAVVVRF